MATATLNDMQILASDAVFGNRVFMSMLQFCATTIAGESITASTLPQHVAKRAYAQQILNGPPETYKQRFVDVAAANQIVANDATASGTLVGMTQAQIATAALSCTDTDINNAVAAAFTAFIAGI